MSSVCFSQAVGSRTGVYHQRDAPTAPAAGNCPRPWGCGLNLEGLPGCAVGEEFVTLCHCRWPWCLSPLCTFVPATVLTSAVVAAKWVSSKLSASTKISCSYPSTRLVCWEQIWGSTPLPWSKGKVAWCSYMRLTAVL